MVTNSKIAYLQDDHTGINIDELNKYLSGALYQMPTHALPTGVTLSEVKRKAITDWLDGGRYVIEDSSQNDFVFGKKENFVLSLP